MQSKGCLNDIGGGGGGLDAIYFLSLTWAETNILKALYALLEF